VTDRRTPEEVGTATPFDRTEPEVPGQLWRAYRKLHISRNNVFNEARRWLSLSVLGRPITDIWPYEKKVYSQHGEDGVLDAIFRVIGTTSRFYVEFGTGDALQRNTRFLAERRGWSGLLMDGGFENPAINLRREFITAENINELFARYDVPHDLDLLSIDIDGNDYWVWENIDACTVRG